MYNFIVIFYIIFRHVLLHRRITPFINNYHTSGQEPKLLVLGATTSKSSWEPFTSMSFGNLKANQLASYIEIASP